MQFDDPTSTLLVSGGADFIGGNAERRNLDLVQEICRLIDARLPRADGLPRESQVTFVDDWPVHDRRYAMTPGKSALSWAGFPRSASTRAWQ